MKKMKTFCQKTIKPFSTGIAVALLFPTNAFATDVSAAIEATWDSALSQIKEVTNNVIFPVITCILAILLFVKLSVSYFEYKKHGEFDFMPIAVLFFGLIFALTAPLYVWNILG